MLLGDCGAADAKKKKESLRQGNQLPLNKSKIRSWGELKDEKKFLIKKKKEEEKKTKKERKKHTHTLKCCFQCPLPECS